jgi:pyruvate dehydrogenase (quinone)
MADTVADFMLSRLSDWGVTRIYGYPGDGINGILGALDRASDRFNFVQVRHEEEAAFMATAHAKFGGGIGVCLATSGPGAIHLLNGLYDAKLDHQPVLAIVGQTVRTAIGGDFQQEVDLHSLFKDVASSFVQTCTAPSQMRHLVDRAMRIAKAERSVTCLIVPNDVQELEYEQPEHAHGTIHSGIGYAAPRVVPCTEDLQRAAAVLNEGKKVAILVGAGALDATDEVISVADTLSAGVAKALLGRAALPDDLPFVTGQIGLLGTRPSWEMMQDCDTLLMVGSSFPYTEFLPQEGQARGVQIDIQPRMLSLRYPMEVPLTGDARDTLRALLPLLEAKPRSDWRESIERNVEQWWKEEEERAHAEADPLNPELVFWEGSRRLPDGTIITADSGSSASWFARALRLRRGMMASISGTLATMCCAIPYATAAKFLHPDRLAVAFVGDGAVQMLGLNGLITIAKYWREWQDPRLIVVVLNNRDLNMVTWELRALGGTPKIDETQNVPDFPYADFAEMLELRGARVASPEEVGPAWEQALQSDRPFVIDAVVDPSVLAVPPQVSFEQAKNYLAAILKGDREAANAVWRSFKQALT